MRHRLVSVSFINERVCDPVAQTGCDDGLVCEEVVGGGSNCFEALVVARGSVFNCADASQAIEGARVVANERTS
jgi:hypothetical protein